MPKSNKTRFRKDKEGRYRGHAPKQIGDAMDLADKKIEWKIKSGNTIELKLHEVEEE